MELVLKGAQEGNIAVRQTSVVRTNQRQQHSVEPTHQSVRGRRAHARRPELKSLRSALCNRVFTKGGEIPLFEVVAAVLRLHNQPAITVATTSTTHDLYRIKPGSWTGEGFALVKSERAAEIEIVLTDVRHIIAPLEPYDEQAEARRAKRQEVTRIRADTPSDIRTVLRSAPNEDEDSVPESGQIWDGGETRDRSDTVQDPPKKVEQIVSVRYLQYAQLVRDRGNFDRSVRYAVNDGFLWCGQRAIVWRIIGPYIDIILPDDTSKRLKGL